jgi:type II secretory pathway pseudopilin PulG
VTLVELLVAAVVTAAVMAGVLASLASSQALFVAQAEAIDVTQRLRVASDVLTRDLRSATLVLPYGPGGPGDDVMTIRAGTRRRVYHVAASGLRRSDDGGADLPVLDGIARVAVEYEAADGPVGRAALTDGPWLPHAADPDRFDADALRVRLVRVIVVATGTRAERIVVAAALRSAGDAP